MDFEALGINITSILIYTALFIIIYIILNKFAIKPLLKILEERQKEIQEGLDLKDKMQEKVEDLEREREEIFTKARKEAKEIIEKTHEEVKVEKKKLIQEAKQEADLIIKQANEHLEAEKQRLEKEMNESVEKAAIKVAKELYSIDKKTIDKELIDKAIKEL